MIFQIVSLQWCCDYLGCKTWVVAPKNERPEGWTVHRLDGTSNDAYDCINRHYCPSCSIIVKPPKDPWYLG